MVFLEFALWFFLEGVLWFFPKALWLCMLCCVVMLCCAVTVFPRLERACSINFRLAPRGVVFEGAL